MYVHTYKYAYACKKKTNNKYIYIFTNVQTYIQQNIHNNMNNK